MDTEVWQKRLATLPLESYGAGGTVFSDGTKTGRLLILKTGLVSIVKGGTQIAKVAEPGVIFGEISALTADVLTWRPRSFTLPTLPHFLCKTQPRSFTLRQTWPGVLMAPTKPSSN